ncbi:MAG: HAD family hydrolase [Candidatus Aenigmarchaeota archaeon]|nr:HAD family hydrolase [Candidatus Aenigmarchaeota archaeon]
MVIKVILLDLDGTLIDSRKCVGELYNHIAERNKLKPPTSEEVDSVFHIPLIQGLMRIYGIPESEAARISEVRYDVYDRILPLIEVDSNAGNVLGNLKRRYKLGIVTGRGSTTYRILNMFGLQSYFDIVVDRTQYANAKPHPECLHVAMKKLGFKPEETVYVGDGGVDVQAANDAGVTSIYLSRTNHPNARYNIEKLEELEPLLMGLS